MGPMILIEVMGRGRSTIERIRVPAATATIGRAYDNDVILDDPFVDGHAARVSLTHDGALMVEDLGALNGVQGPAGPVVGPTRIEPGGQLRVGRTRLRLVTPETRVQPATPDMRDRLLGIVTSGRGIVTGLVATILVWWAYTYSTSAVTMTPQSIGGQMVGILIILALWAGVWAVASRLTTGHGRFTAHLGVVSWVVSIGLPVGFATELLPFLWPGGATRAIVALVSTLFGLALLHLHLGVSFRMNVRRRAAIAVAVIAGFWIAGAALVAVDDDPATQVASSLGSLWPVAEARIPARSVDDFLIRLEDVDERLEELAEDS